MYRIAVIYFTKTDVTGKLAKALISGIQSTGVVEVVEYKIAGQDIVEGRFDNQDLFAAIATCDAIIFGSPTYMGGASAQFKAFADASSEAWVEQQWAGKIAAGFTSGSAVNGDQTSTLQYYSTLASQHGMLWVGLDAPCGYTDLGVNRLGCQLGVVAHSPDGTVHETDLATASYLGKRVAEIAKNLKPSPSQ